MLRVRLLYLKLRCRSDHRQGRSHAHGRRCVCAISPLRPQEAQHFCPLTSRLRSLPDPAAASVRLAAKCVTKLTHCLCTTSATPCLLPLVREPACPRFQSAAPAERTAALVQLKYSNNHQLPGFASASSRPDIRPSTRNHGRYHCVDTTAPVELREAYH